MLRPSGEAVFLDFGLSRHDELPDLLGEESDVPMGTAPYLAPEQIFGERGEPLSDIYALGVMLYEFVTGEILRQPEAEVRHDESGCGATPCRRAR